MKTPNKEKLKELFPNVKQGTAPWAKKKPKKKTKKIYHSQDYEAKKDD